MSPVFRYSRRMHDATRKLSMAQVLICGAAIVTLSMGIRHGFGLWLQPVTQDMGWTRQTFALAMALVVAVVWWQVRQGKWVDAFFNATMAGLFLWVGHYLVEMRMIAASRIRLR